MSAPFCAPSSTAGLLLPSRRDDDEAEADGIRLTQLQLARAEGRPGQNNLSRLNSHGRNFPSFPLLYLSEKAEDLGEDNFTLEFTLPPSSVGRFRIWPPGSLATFPRESRRRKSLSLWRHLAFHLPTTGESPFGGSLSLSFGTFAWAVLAEGLSSLCPQLFPERVDEGAQHADEIFPRRQKGEASLPSTPLFGRNFRCSAKLHSPTKT